MNKKYLEGIIQAMEDSLEVVSHNPTETEYLTKLIEERKRHYRQVIGRDYNRKELYINRTIDGGRA